MKYYNKNIGILYSLLVIVALGTGVSSALADSASAKKKPQVESNANAGGQKICLTANGDLRTRGRCKASKGELQINASNLATIADISFTGIPAGQTVTGVLGGDFDSAALNSTWGATSSLPAQLDPALTASDVIVAATTELLSACGGVASNCLSASELATASLCTGTTSSPTAPEGKLCIYPYSLANASSINGVPAGATPATNASGFEVTWTAAAVGDTRFAAAYAYTAPDDE